MPKAELICKALAYVAFPVPFDSTVPFPLQKPQIGVDINASCERGSA